MTTEKNNPKITGKDQENHFKRKLMIAPSVGCCDLFHVKEEMDIINAHSDFLHMDIKDGVYVPSFGIGPDFLDYLNQHVKNLKPMDAHLMIAHPQNYLKCFADAGATWITPHTDCIEGDAFVTMRKIKDLARIRKERGLHFLIEADGSMNSQLYRPLYEAGADMVVLGPPALWNKDQDFRKAWSVMEEELKTELADCAVR